MMKRIRSFLSFISTIAIVAAVIATVVWWQTRDEKVVVEIKNTSSYDIKVSGSQCFILPILDLKLNPEENNKVSLGYSRLFGAPRLTVKLYKDGLFSHGHVVEVSADHTPVMISTPNESSIKVESKIPFLSDTTVIVVSDN